MTEGIQAEKNVRPRPPAVWRWSVLVIISLAMFGNYYVYDAISPLADVLSSQLNFSDSDIGLLKSIYSFPNIFLLLVAGIIIDKIGTKKATFLYGTLCFAGAVLAAISPQLEIMAAGWLVFGIGAESLIVSVTTAIAKWFKGKELSFAFGLNLTIARLGSFAAFNSPTWAKPAYENWQWPLFISIGFASLCIIGAGLYWIMENRAMRKYSLGEAETEKVEWKGIFKFSKSYWYIVGLCFVFYGAIFPFQTFAVKFFIDAHGATREFGGFLLSLLTLFAMVATPLFGLLVDNIGKRSLIMIGGTILVLPVFLIMGYTGLSLYIPMIMMGISFSLIPAIMWPSVTYAVPENKLGTAYGLMTMLQNIGLFAFNYILGWSNDLSKASEVNPAGYNTGLLFLTGLCVLGVIFAILLRRNETGPNAHGLETITTKTSA